MKISAPARRRDAFALRIGEGYSPPWKGPKEAMPPEKLKPRTRCGPKIREGRSWSAGKAPVRSGRRTYAPRLGRWISRDPLGEQGGLNLYSIVNNSPIVYYDPLGESVVGDGWDSLGKYADPSVIYRQLKNLRRRFRQTACPKIKAAQNSDIISCGCAAIGIADVASAAPWIEGLDCACNALSSLGQMCDTGFLSWQFWAYSTLTALDCVSAPVAIVLGSLIGETVDPAGGGLIGAIIGATPAGDAVVDVAAMALQNVISQGTPLPVSQGKSCCNLIAKAAPKLVDLPAKAECVCRRYQNH